jgi:hypothetical protein
MTCPKAPERGFGNFNFPGWAPREICREGDLSGHFLQVRRYNLSTQVTMICAGTSSLARKDKKNDPA